MYRYDVRVLEKSGSRNLTSEPLNDLLARKLPGQNHLYSDNALQANLPRAKNHTHAAAGNLIEKFVVAEVTNRLMGGGGIPGITRRISYWGRVGKLSAGTVERRIETALQQAASAKALR